MRGLRNVGAGALVAFGFLGLGASLDRPYSYMLVFIASCAILLTLGLALSAGASAWAEGQWWFVIKRLYHVTVGSPKQHDEQGKQCSSCHRPMSEIRFTWVCGSCDHVKVLV